MFEGVRLGKIKARPGPTAHDRSSAYSCGKASIPWMILNFKKVTTTVYPNREKVERNHFLPQTGGLKEASLEDPQSIGLPILTTMEPVDCSSWWLPAANWPPKSRLSDVHLGAAEQVLSEDRPPPGGNCCPFPMILDEHLDPIYADNIHPACASPCVCNHLI